MPKSRALTVYTASRRWTKTDAEAVLAALDASGLTVSAFARREGLDEQRLYWWRRQLGSAAPASAPVAPSFVEITARPLAHVEIVLRSGRVLRVAEAIDARTLSRLVETLERDGSC